MYQSIRSPKLTEQNGSAADFFNKHAICSNKRTQLLIGSSTLNGLNALDELKNIIKEQSREILITELPKGEPDDISVDKLAEEGRSYRPDIIVAVGGGSAIDYAKALSMLTTNEGQCRDYIEGKGTKKSVSQKTVELCAIPTTAGSGSEATMNAVVTLRLERQKKSLRSPELIADYVLLNPNYLKYAPKKLKALCGFDALTQLIESSVSIRSSDYIKTLALYGIRLFKEAFLISYEDADNIEAHSKIQMAAYISGHCLMNGGLGAAHGLASGIGGAYPGLNHGYITAVLLPHIIRMNVRADEKMFGEIGKILSGKDHINDFEAAMKGAEYIENIKEKMNIPYDFKANGIDGKDITVIIENAYGNSMKGNPYKIEPDELKKFMEKLI